MFTHKTYYKALVFLYLCSIPSFLYATELHTSVNDLMPVEISYPTALSSQLGAAVSAAGDFDGDGLQDFAIGAPSFEGIHINRLQDKGAVFIIYGKSIQQKTKQIDLSQTNSNHTLITGNQDYPVGQTISSLNDFNADGFHDISFGTENGKAGIVIYGNNDYETIVTPDSYESHGVTLTNTGISLSKAGDVDGDHFPDALFGNPQAEVITKENQSLTYGAFTLLFGGNDLLHVMNALVPTQNYFYTFTNRGTPNSSFGMHVSGGADFDNDGFYDIIITSKPKETGEAYVIFGGSDVFSNTPIQYGLTLQSVVGYAEPCGDINADNYKEMIVGLPDNQALLIEGNEDLRGTIDLSETPQQWGTLFQGVDRIYSVGDLNGDGFSDIAAAMPQANVGNQVMAGQVLFLFGSPQFPKIINIEDIRKGRYHASDYVFINGMQAFDTFGKSIAGIGDLQNDGFEDVLIGAPGKLLPGDTMQKKSGKAYFIQGIEFYYALQTHRSSFSQGSQQR